MKDGKKLYLVFTLILMSFFLINFKSLDQEKTLKVNDSFWYFDFGDGIQFEEYFGEDYFIESNGLVARKLKYVLGGDSICFDYVPNACNHLFLKIIRFTNDTIELRSPYGGPNDGVSKLVRSNEKSFLESFKGHEREGLIRIFHGTKFYDRIKEIEKMK